MDSSFRLKMFIKYTTENVTLVSDKICTKGCHRVSMYRPNCSSFLESPRNFLGLPRHLCLFGI